MKPIFFLRHFNDVDHIAPIMWYCLEQGDEVSSILLDRNYSASDDPRLEFLRNYETFELEYADSFLDLKWAKPFYTLSQPDGRAPKGPMTKYVKRLLQISGIAKRKVAPALEELGPTACIFEWGSPYRTSHREFFEASDSLDIPTLCFPHGLNIYLNEDIKPGRKKAFEQANQTMTSRNEYDAYVTQSQHDKEQEGKLGVVSDIHHVLGSARYYPEWQSINRDLYDAYKSTGDSTEKTKVVFMLPHWEYNVDKGKTTQLISDLADHDWVYLIVKEHTRGDSLPEGLDDRLVQQDNTEVMAEVPSVSLIKWADAVINFGSSIGIEALQQNKYHVNPSYLHSNITIFDKTGAGHRPGSNEETIWLLKDIHQERLDTVSQKNKRELYRSVVYGGKEEHNVLARYRDLIERLANT